MALSAWRPGVHKKGPEGTQPRHLTPTDQRHFSYRMLQWWAIKAGGRRRRKWKTFAVVTFVFPSHHHMWWSPAFMGMAAHLHVWVHGKQWINSFSCFVVYLLCFLYLNPQGFAFLPRFLPSSCQGGARKQCGSDLPDGVKPWHLKQIIFLKTAQFPLHWAELTIKWVHLIKKKMQNWGRYPQCLLSKCSLCFKPLEKLVITSKPHSTL